MECGESFRSVLHDIPLLLDDLDIAISGWSRFVERGARSDTDAVTAGLNPAVKAQQRLEAALKPAGEWFDAKAPWFIAAALATHLHRLAGEPRMPQLARDISQAASRAHHVIDAPQDFVYYGPCPDCGRDIIQERIHKDDDETQVTCRYPSCNYAKTLDLHYKKILDANEDRWMTVSELVSAITSGGEIVDRNQIYYWERKAGLAREMRTRAKWVNGDLVTNEVWCFRLGDVRQRAADAAKRNAKMTT